jgi:hypothetical protein
MKTRSQKIQTNVALRVAMVESELLAYVIARRARMTPDRLSKIAKGHLLPSTQEQRALARVLGRQVHELFPGEPDAVSA